MNDKHDLLIAAVEVEKLQEELAQAYQQLFAFAEDYKVMKVAMDNKCLEVESLRLRLSQQTELNNTLKSS
ncbi:MAG: hypothetical protein PHI29_12120 [Gallionella sp.]|nr:hypothetical protein [Gallionella sp.]